ncbi:MAG TPA: LuxR C-terminal-related transcriptional regulator [Candidatus Limnocylindrales bacterium]|nr:LuxR C-terminal-related transcriptional regulator [Candidatus Limnocylindrales bacterium]
MSAGILGRAAEIDAVARAMDGDRPVVVVGEAGIGKTVVVRAAAVAAGRLLHEGGAFATLAWRPYLALEHAVARPLRGDEAWVAAAVERAVGPDVLFVDDAQWANPATLDVLRALAGRVALVLAVRSGDPGEAVALDLATAVGATLVELGPLPVDVAVGVALAAAPGLTEARARAAATTGGGNPFVVRELAASGEPDTGLRRAIAARVQALDDDARAAVALLALAERPLPAEAVPGGDALARSGLAVRSQGGLAIRHELLAEAVLQLLDEDGRRSAHLALAGIVDGPGERARHLAAAGDRGAAHRLALEAVAAAATPGERAAHLGVAAATADGPAADLLRIEAAAALRVAGDLAAAAAAADAVGSADPETRALAAAVRARIHWSAGEPEPMRAALARGLELVGGTGSPAEALLRAELVTITALVDGRFDAGLADAEAAVELARRAGADPTRALLLRATILAGLGRPGWDEALEAVITAARAAGDAETELSAANNLVTGHEMHGRPAEGRALAAAMLDRAAALRLGGWTRQFGAMLANLDLHAGALAAALGRAQALLEEDLDPLARQQVGLVAALALVDLGRHEQAQPLLDRLYVDASPDVTGRGDVLFVQAEAALWGGRPLEALERLDGYREFAESEYPTSFLVDVTAGWAAMEAGRPIPDPLARGEPAGMLIGSHRERGALEALAAGRDAAAIGQLRDAAAAYAGFHRRGELRTRWAAAEAARRAGDGSTALADLEALEPELEAQGFMVLLGRVHRSLRLLGSRRAARATSERPAILTPRERELVELVGRGLTNPEIARRLGLGRPTVARLLSNAMLKLGVDSRAQLAARLPELA